MIKVNLLDSVTERHGGAAVAVERKIGSPVSRLVLMVVAVSFLLLTVVSWDIISTQMNKASAERNLEDQKKLAAELETVMKEQKELEAKIQNIDLRIDAIKKLRATQAGPSAVLDAMVERIQSAPGIYLESIEQTGDVLTIKGSSTDESVVTQFGRSLEFSGGLFSNLNIETQRKPVEGQRISAEGGTPDAGLEIVGFTIRCAYTPEKSGDSAEGSTVADVVVPDGSAKAPASNAANPPQVAKN